MLTSLFLAPLLAASPAPRAADACQGTQRPGAARLDLTATGLRSSRGDVVFSVYPDNASRFLASRAYVGRLRVKAQGAQARACFWLPPAHYAVALYHDENGDRKFNRMLFVPKEGFGVSNDAPTTLGLPKFAAVRFALPAAGRGMAIRTRYSR